MRANRSLFLPLILLCLSLCSNGQSWSGVLAPSRAIDWTKAGVVGGIPDGSWTQCGSTIAPYVGTAAIINNALSACGANQYVLLGAGIFNLSTYIQWNKNNVVLRGSGSNWSTGTRLVFGSGAHSGDCNGVFADICIIATTLNDSQNNVNVGNWVGSYSQGSTSIQLGTQSLGSTKPAIGMTLILDQLTDGATRGQDTGNIFTCTTAPVCTQGGSGASERTGRAEQQTVTVTSITGGTCTDSNPCTVGIAPAIYMPNWRSGQSPQAWWANGPYVSGAGVENMAIDSSADDQSKGNLSAICMFNAQNSWVKNVHSERVLQEPVVLGTNRHIRLYQSHNITIRDSYFHGRAADDDYGINFWESSDNLIENNIFQSVGTPMNHENGNGNVFGYNFTVNNDWGEQSWCSPSPFPCWAQGSIYGHGAHEHYALAEGNIAYGIEFENYFGNTFFVTAFRNRFYGYQTHQQNQTVPLFVYGLNRYFNIVGNVLGTSSYHTTYQTVGGGNPSNCVYSVYAIGLGGNCNNGDGVTWPLDDTLVTNTAVTTMLRWGNYDTATATNRFVNAEVPSGISPYPNPVPANQTLPPSFYLNSQPNWWSTGKAWPPIGPDVTGGTVGSCSGSTYPLAVCSADSQCGTGNTCQSAGLNHEAVSNPAMDCYFSIGGTPDGNTLLLPNFDANACYGDPPPPPAPPTGLSAVVE